jgi:hypothetical protein
MISVLAAGVAVEGLVAGQCAADVSDEGHCAFSLAVARESSHESEKKNSSLNAEN